MRGQKPSALGACGAAVVGLFAKDGGLTSGHATTFLADTGYVSRRTSTQSCADVAFGFSRTVGEFSREVGI